MAIFIISTAILSIIFGIVIFIFPKLLNRIIAIWLISYGILQLLQSYTTSNSIWDLFSLKEILIFFL
jgi:hypothetical protein